MTTSRRYWLIHAGAAGAGAMLPLPSRAAPQPGAAPAAKTLTVFGTRLRYLELGRPGVRPTLVLLHGLGSSAQGDWGAVLAPLAQHFHVLAPDQLGFGGSDKPAIRYGIQTWVDFLGEFLRLKGVASGFTLAGESLGGWIAARYTAQALQGQAVGPSFVLPKPQRLLLCDAAGMRPPVAPSADAGAAPLGGYSVSLAGQKAILAQVFHAPAYSDDNGVRRGMAWSLSKGDSQTIASFTSNPGLAGEMLDGTLAAITIPTMVAWGEHDALVPVASGQRMAAEIPGARWVLIPGTGHAPMIETPAAFLSAVQPFLLER